MPKYKKFLLVILIPWATIFFTYRLFNRPINFYGMVVDQDDKPIPGVKITASIIGINPLTVIPHPDLVTINRTISRKTDKNGRFKIKGYYGDSLSFYYGNSFKKHRYEFVLDDAPDYFIARSGKYRGYLEYHSPTTTSVKKFTPTNPVVYRMRKLLEPTYVLHQERTSKTLILQYDTEEKTSYFDLIRCLSIRPQGNDGYSIVGNGGQRSTNDLRITSIWEESHNRWAITLAPGAGKGGIQIHNKKLYTAPEGGYESEVTFYITRGMKLEKVEHIFLKESANEPFLLEKVIGRSHNRMCYFYLVSRDSEIHSRIEMIFDPFGSDRRIWFELVIAVNPYSGHRSLELEPNISYELKKALDKEIKEAFAKDPNAIIPPPTPEMFKMPDSQIPQIMAERQRLISK
ncbi:MAG: hypothetical protein FWG02_10960 [Holophagaceae bacterium]|nr:hypothetical protein [Holophagaceae bacterium]